MKRRRESKLKKLARELAAAIQKEREAFSAAGYAREARKRVQQQFLVTVGTQR